MTELATYQPGSLTIAAEQTNFSDEQTKALTQYHQDNPPAKDAPKPNPPQEAMASLCQILCSSNRFLYIE